MQILTNTLMESLNLIKPKMQVYFAPDTGYGSGCGCSGDCGQSCSGGCESGCTGDCGRSCSGDCS